MSAFWAPNDLWLPLTLKKAFLCQMTGVAIRFCEPISSEAKFLKDEVRICILRPVLMLFLLFKLSVSYLYEHVLLFFGNPRRRQRGGQQLWRVLNGTVGRPRKVRRNTKRFTLIPYFEIISVASFHLSKFLPQMVLTAFALVH